MNRLRINKVGILSFAKIYGVIMTGLGFLIGLLYAVIGVIGAMATGEEEMMWMALGICIAPVLYGVLGFVGGAITAFLYNLAAGWVGGVEIETEQV